jgi:hypothetical protein
MHVHSRTEVRPSSWLTLMTIRTSVLYWDVLCLPADVNSDMQWKQFTEKRCRDWNVACFSGPK